MSRSDTEKGRVGRVSSVLGKAKLPSLGPAQAVYAILLVVCIAGLVLSPGCRTPQNVVNVMSAVSFLGIVAVGMTYVTLSGNFVDLSVGAVVAAAATTAVLLLPYSLALAVAAGIVVGLLVGSINGLLVGFLGANPVIITLGAASIIEGLTLTVSGGRVIYARSEAFDVLGNARVAGIPITVLLFLALVVLGHLHVKRTVWGRRLLGTGMNAAVMRLSGLRPQRIAFAAFVIAGGVAATSGVLLAASTDSANPSLGQTFPFDAITAVVLGGSRLQGGQGSILGTLGGVLVVGVLSNLMVLTGVPFPYQQVVKGVILVAALGAQLVVEARSKNRA